jgi:serine kinase of HPr protein (carbohydrate metabolism regulator)
MMIDCPLVIITADRMVSQSMIDKANEENICLLSTHLHTHEVIRDLLIRGLL